MTMKTQAELREIVEREKKQWVKCRVCGVPMHYIFFETHACSDPTPALDGSRFQKHADVIDEGTERAR